MGLLQAARQPLPRSWSWALGGLAVVAAVVVIRHLPQSHVYLKSWGARSPRIEMPWDVLSTAMDERALKAAMPMPLRCIDEAKESNGLGDRVCYTPVDAVDGVAALTVAFFLDEGRLAQATVQLPWWAHHAMAGQLARRLGAPVAIQDKPVRGVRLLQWRLPNGSININRDPGWDPLAWSAVLWTPLQARPLPAAPPSR
ncbi:hypothetical protein [Ramlibacter algicola]|uniref:Uncharacterized protein n=1 Tax=Ramlibacter algicola TaxID=2795217 RepID=A0A934Q2D1_9BURK|nr:hypothetical protein [Ramlibacter algicola]MBK0394744.1 hypothetical protein [Ramlibacter algicola]